MRDIWYEKIVKSKWEGKLQSFSWGFSRFIIIEIKIDTIYCTFSANIAHSRLSSFKSSSNVIISTDFHDQQCRATVHEGCGEKAMKLFLVKFNFLMSWNFSFHKFVRRKSWKWNIFFLSRLEANNCNMCVSYSNLHKNEWKL